MKTHPWFIALEWNGIWLNLFISIITKNYKQQNNNKKINKIITINQQNDDNKINKISTKLYIIYPKMLELYIITWD